MGVVVAVTRSRIARRIAMFVGVISLVVVIAAVAACDSYGGQHH
jgi:hypothetical protein